MRSGRIHGWRRGAVVAALIVAGILPWTAGPAGAGAQVTHLNGSAYGAFVKVGLFGGPPGQVGADPVVVLPASGERQTKSLPKLIGQFGPATVFGGQYEDPGMNPSGKLTVTTEGKTGPGGFVTSTAEVVNIGPGPMIADKMTSTCRADESGVTGSATITEGIVETSYDVETQEPKTKVEVPAKPAPNTAFEGMLDHIGDRFRIVYNEQVVEGDTIIVRAAHMYLLGDIAVGDMIVGQTVCGLSPDADGSTAPPTTAPGSAGPATSLPPVPTEPEGETEAAASASDDDDDSGGVPVAVPIVGGTAAAALAAAFIVRRRRADEEPPTLEAGPEPGPGP
ncbi:MAG: hypothetical protein ACRD0N_04935 [Acidimicrobiales bacterium]